MSKFVLHMDPDGFGLRAKTVQAAYASLEEAQAQAACNLATGKQEPFYIADEGGAKVVNYQAMSADERQAEIDAYRADEVERRIQQLRDSLAS